MYQALYRKWRPQTFDEVIGQQHITEVLKNQVSSGRLSHAYLFIGTRGTGKTTCARILAKAVNCEHPVNGNPCGKCPACLGISDGSVLDVVELDAASNNSVDNVRALRDEAVFTPASVRKRVYIIDEVHMLSGSAFNALLKILEEPPEHLMFILATTELQKVPATILSRCQRHSFRRIDAPVIADYLMSVAGKEGFELSRDAADLIARLSDGGVRDAMSLLDQCSANRKIDLDAVYSSMGLAGMKRTVMLMNEIAAHNTEKALKAFNSMWMDGKDPATLIGELSNLLRDTLMMKVAPKGGINLISGGFDTDTLSSLGERLTKEEILCAMETLQNALSAMRTSTNPKTAAELCLISLCDSALGESVSELRARISRLEAILAGGVPLIREAAVQNKQSRSEDYTDEADRKTENTERNCRSCGEPYNADDDDELDAEMFVEEQPEDSFLERPSKQAAPEAAPEVKREPSWQDICNEASELLPLIIRQRLGESTTVTGALKGDVLQIKVVPGFFYGQINRPDNLKKFSAAATKLCGREINAVISELRDEPQKTRSLEELKQYPEVRFN